MQSALEPAGPAAAAIHDLTLVLTTGAALVFALVMALLVVAVRGGPRPASTALWAVGGGIVFPAAVLSALLVHGIARSRVLTEPPPPDALAVEVVGWQWWWEVRYPAAGNGQGPVVTANELHVPVGRAVVLRLSTADVIHSIWIPSLAGKMDMIPGRTTHLTLQADREGVWRGQCAEYCGTQHASMALHVTARSAPAFAAWLAAEGAPAAAPATPALERAYQAFLASGCAGCHAIRGTPAAGRLGPDLTHVASRRTLGAGTIDNGPAALALWISAHQHVKPGNRMPSNPDLDGETVAAIAAYLTQLR
jgi:cytochrome c oxidase subunit 2